MGNSGQLSNIAGLQLRTPQQIVTEQGIDMNRRNHGRRQTQTLDDIRNGPAFRELLPDLLLRGQCSEKLPGCAYKAFLIAAFFPVFELGSDHLAMFQWCARY